MRRLTIEPLSKHAFAPFGEVIETAGSAHFAINNGSTQRYHRLAEVQTARPDDQAIISIFRAQALHWPLTIDMLERHPLGSQAFMPLLGNRFVIVVAPAGEQPEPGLMRAFITDGKQGINYRRGVWHHPVLSLRAQDDFLVVDRSGAGHNCDEYFFAEPHKCWLDPHTPE